MKFYSFYTLKNIKNSKASSYLISFCIFLVSLLLMVLLCMPKFVKNVEESSMRRFYGTSDVYIAPNLNKLTNFFDILGNYSDVDQDTKDQIEYFSPLIAIPGDIANDGAYLLLANVYDINKFNEVEIVKGNADTLEANEIVVPESYAKEYSLDIDSTVKLYVFGYQKEFKVKAIAKNSGIFSGLDREVVVCSRQSIKYLDILPITIDPLMFNLAVLKVKDPSKIDNVISSLKEVFPRLSIGKTVDINIIQETIDEIMPIYYIIFSIICLFGLFTTFYICYNKYKSRIVEFSRIKCMGGSNQLLLLSIILENAFYATIGILGNILISTIVLCLGMKFPSLAGLNPLNLLYSCLFGYLFSFLFIPFAYISFIRKSIKQTMSQIPRTKFRWIGVVFNALSVVGSIITLILLCTLKLSNIANLGLYITFAITFILAAPLYLRAIISVFSFITRKSKNFLKLYLNRFTNYSSTPLFIRLIAFSVFAIILMTVLHSSIQNKMQFSVKEQHYNITLSNVSLSSESDLNNININTVKEMDYVLDAYAVTSSSAKINDKNYTVYGYSTDDIIKIYSADMIEGTANSNSNLILGPYFKYVLGYNVNDNITLQFDNNSTVTLRIDGFSNNYYNNGQTVIVNKTIVQNATDLKDNRLFINAESGHISDVLSTLKTTYRYNMLVLENTERTNSKIYEISKSMIISIYLFIFIVVVMIILALTIAYKFLINNLETQMLTFSILGLDENRNRIIVCFQILIYCVFALLMGLVLLFTLKMCFTSIIANLNIALKFNNNIFFSVLFIVLMIVVLFIISMGFYNKKTVE